MVREARFLDQVAPPSVERRKVPRSPTMTIAPEPVCAIALRCGSDSSLSASWSLLKVQSSPSGSAALAAGGRQRPTDTWRVFQVTPPSLVTSIRL